MSDKLSTESQYLNEITLRQLSIEMHKHNLTRADVARILGVHRSLVTRWYRGDKRCPDHAPATIRAAMEIPTAENTQHILKRYHSNG